MEHSRSHIPTLIMDDQRRIHGMNDQNSSIGRRSPANNSLFRTSLPPGLSGSMRTRNTIAAAPSTTQSITQTNRRRSTTWNNQSSIPTPTVQTTRRRSTTLGSAPVSSNIGFLNTPINNRDPRPLRDKNFQDEMAKDIFEFSKDVDPENAPTMGLPLDVIKHPTQKAFIKIFQWLYKQIDPYYKYTKVENDIYQILRNLRYPYLNSINKSHIAAVGGSNWPKFLGMLHWLVKVIQNLNTSFKEIEHSNDKMSNLNENSENSISNIDCFKSRAEIDNRQDYYESLLENLFNDYVIKSYKDFLNFNDANEETNISTLQNEYSKIRSFIENDLRILKGKNDSDQQELNVLTLNYQKFQIEKQKSIDLKSDIEKFETYIKGMESREPQYNLRLQKMKQKKESTQKLVQSMSEQITKLENQLAEKNLNINYFDSKLEEIDQLEKKINEAFDQSDHLVASIQSAKRESDSTFTAFIETVQNYSTQLKRVIDTRKDFEKNEDINYEDYLLPIDLDSIKKPDGSNPITYDNLFSKKDYKIETIQANFTKLQEYIEDDIKDDEIELQKLTKEIESREIEKEKKYKEYEKLSLELENLKSQYDSEKQNCDSALLSKELDVERLESKILAEEHQVKQKKSNFENELKNLEFQKNTLIKNTENKKYLLRMKLLNIIDFISKFQLDFDDTFINLENLISKNFDENLEIKMEETLTLEGEEEQEN